jgi:signal transduction histidine kinase
LRDSEQELYFSQKHREKFSEMVLHDLQSPLKFLSRIADHLYQKITAGTMSGLQELAYDLQQSTRQVTQFSTDYLNWLKTNTGSSQKKKEQVDVRRIMEKVCALFEQLARSKNNALTCSGSAELMVFTIPDYLEIIIRNLVDNANKYTSQGSIAVACSVVDGIKQVSIKDTGDGIDAAGIARINDLFAGQEVTITSDSLGLQIVYGLLTACGGQLKAESEQGKGTTIIISFPDNDEHDSQKQG